MSGSTFTSPSVASYSRSVSASSCGDIVEILHRVPDLVRVPKSGAYQSLIPRLEHAKAKVAVAQKLAVILRREWIDGTEFNWSKAKDPTA